MGEQAYLDLVQRIIEDGVKKSDRTGTGTLSIFGAQLRFDLSGQVLPLFTTKRVFFRGIVEELLWIIRGDTNSNNLSKLGVKFWDANGSKEFIEKLGFTDRKQGDLGPVYGHQWRHFGADYKTCDDDYTGQGVDQLANAIHLIKTNPDSRRIIINAWNPVDIPKMNLPPCHMQCQFYVANGKLSCQLYQRSCDMGLGVPFNVASYSLLTHMIAHVCGLKAGEFVHTMGDAHVYLNHVEPLKKQLKRKPRKPPTISFDNAVTDIDSFSIDSMCVFSYNPHGKIHMDMSA